MTAAARRLRPLGWMSTTQTYGCTHYVDADGRASCSKLIAKTDGLPLRAPFVTPFVPRDPYKHLCRECLRLHPGEVCGCGRCTARALGPGVRR